MQSDTSPPSTTTSCYQHPHANGLKPCLGCERLLCAECLAQMEVCSGKCHQRYLHKRWRFGFPVLATLFSLWLLARIALYYRQPEANAAYLHLHFAVCLWGAFPSLASWLRLKLQHTVTLPALVDWGFLLGGVLVILLGEYSRGGFVEDFHFPLSALLAALVLAALVGAGTWYGARFYYQRQAYGVTEHRQWSEQRTRGRRSELQRMTMMGGGLAWLFWLLERLIGGQTDIGVLTLLAQVLFGGTGFACYGLGKWQIQEANYQHWQAIEDARSASTPLENTPSGKAGNEYGD